MKYTSEILVNLPLHEFLKKLLDYNTLKHWQHGFDSFEHISGEMGTLGAKMKLNYSFGSRKIGLIETITKDNLPHEFHVFHDIDGLHNIHQNYFEETLEGKTKWVFKSECIPTTFSMSFKTLLMPGIFKKQTLKYLSDFKNFAEKGVSVVEYA